MRSAIIIITLAVILLYSLRKSLGLWSSSAGKSSDLILFGLNLNTSVPALLLLVVAVGCGVVIWYQLIELLTRLELTENGLRLFAPGYRLFYRWDEIRAMDIINRPQEDCAARLSVATGVVQSTEEVEKPANPAEVTTYLSEIDRRKNKEAHRQEKVQRKAQIQVVRARATRADGQQLGFWLRLVYPQTRRPDQIYLYPALDERDKILAEIKGHLSK